MGKVRYVETQCKSALNRVQGMPFRWSLNPYRGCRHGCVYCYARGYHGLMGRDVGEGFDSEIEIKVNFPEVLRRELRSGRVDSMVALGTATDPYQPCEGRYRVTRRSLEVLLDYRVPVSMVTKSPMVLRDVDLLAELSALTGDNVYVYFTVTTVDLKLWRQVEPGTANPFKRLEVMRTLRTRGINAGVLCAPILPGLTDSEAAIDAVARAARDHDAYSFSPVPLRLGPQVKEYYLDFIASAFPVLLSRYEAHYRQGQYLDREYQSVLRKRFERVRERHGFGRSRAETPRSTPRPPTTRPQQLALRM